MSQIDFIEEMEVAETTYVDAETIRELNDSIELDWIDRPLTEEELEKSWKY